MFSPEDTITGLDCWEEGERHLVAVGSEWKIVKYLEDERLLEIRADLEERRRQYCEASGLNASSVLTAAHASDIVRVWCEKSFERNQLNHQTKRKLFRDYLYDEYGGYKIVYIVLRAGVMDAALLKSYAKEILKGRPPKASGGVPVPAVPTARTAPPKSVRRETRWSENQVVKRRKREGWCQRCGNDWANAGECEVCHLVCGRCCIWDGHSVCQDCPKIDRRREYGSLDYAVDRVIHDWQQTRAFGSLEE